MWELRFWEAFLRSHFRTPPFCADAWALDGSAWWDIGVFLCGFHAVTKWTGPSTDITSGIVNTMMIPCVVMKTASHPVTTDWLFHATRTTHTCYILVTVLEKKRVQRWTQQGVFLDGWNRLHARESSNDKEEGRIGCKCVPFFWWDAWNSSPHSRSGHQNYCTTRCPLLYRVPTHASDYLYCIVECPLYIPILSSKIIYFMPTRLFLVNPMTVSTPEEVRVSKRKEFCRFCSCLGASQQIL